MTENQKQFENLPVESPAPVPMELAPSGDIFFNVESFELAQRVARMFSESTMVPDHFRGNIGNCLIALNLANRMKCDPFMILQNVYLIHGKPGIEAKLAIALVNNSGKFTPLQYKYNDNETECYAYAKHTLTGEMCKGVTVSIQMAKDEGWYSKKGSKWQTMGSLMLMYRSAMFFARAYCPESLLGMQSREELYDVGAVEMISNGAGSFTPEPTTEDLAAQIMSVDEMFDTESKIKNHEQAIKAQIKSENNGTVPQDKPTVVIDDGQKPDVPWYHTDNWMNLKAPGFGAFIIDNENLIDSIPQNATCEYKRRAMTVADAFVEKWTAIYPDKPFPGSETLDPEPDTVPQTTTQFAEKLRDENMNLNRMFPETWEAARVQFGFVNAIGTLSDEAVQRWNAKINELVDAENS